MAAEYPYQIIKPKIFIGSSLEGKDIADGIHGNLHYKFECTVWDQDVFKLSDYTLDSLIEILERVHYAVLVFPRTTLAESDKLSISLTGIMSFLN